MPAKANVNDPIRTNNGRERMKEAKRDGLEIIIRNMMGKVLFPIKNKKVEKSLNNYRLPKQTQSMVVIIDRILDDYRKQKKPPFSYNWIRYS